MDEQELPRMVTIAGQTYVPALMRIEDRREHDGLPDNLTYLADDDMIELSEDQLRNQFIVAYVRQDTFMKGKKTC